MPWAPQAQQLCFVRAATWCVCVTSEGPMLRLWLQGHQRANLRANAPLGPVQVYVPEELHESGPGAKKIRLGKQIVEHLHGVRGWMVRPHPLLVNRHQQPQAVEHNKGTGQEAETNGGSDCALNCVKCLAGVQESTAPTPCG